MPTNPYNIALPLPVNGTITSGFGLRKPPKLGASSFHKGIDIGCPVGTPVYAPADGNVISEHSSSLGGNILVIQHTANLSTEYMHLSRYAVNVGDSIIKGQIVAYTGATGNVTGPHLHYEVLYNGQPVDPLQYSNYNTNQLDPNFATNSISHAPANLVPVAQAQDTPRLITVNSKYITTLDQFIAYYSIVNISASGLLAYKDNNSRILKGYTAAQKQANNNEANVDLITLGTTIWVPMVNMNSNINYNVNVTTSTNDDYAAFIEVQMRNILFDAKYIRLNDNNSLLTTGGIYKRINYISVWIWCKAASPDGGFLYDITPYIKNINTTVGENGGNFSLNLPHWAYQRDSNTLEYKLPLQTYNYNNGQSYVAKSVAHQQLTRPANPITTNRSQSDNDDQQNQTYWSRYSSFFKDLIAENDVIYIRYEKLGNDFADYVQKPNELTKIDPSQLPGKIYDMIGLVDQVLVTSNSTSNAQEINVTGRDLSKLLLDDGAFFFPVTYAVKDPEEIVKNSSKTKSADRLFLTVPPDTATNPSNAQYTNSLKFATDGSIVGTTYFNFDQTMSISQWLTFMFAQLTNVIIAPPKLLASYPDNALIVSSNVSTTATGGTVATKKISATGIWQIVKLVTDTEVNNRRTEDSSLATDTGSLLNLVQKVCQKPFIDFYSDTYGDKFYFIARKPPFVESSYNTNKFIDIYEEDVISDNLATSTEVYTMFRLTPNGAFLDTQDGTFMTFLPAVILPELLDLYGMKILDIQTNFLDFDMSVSAQTAINVENIIEQGKADLDWLIEAYAYLPFTRTGNITLKGDRRIKRGTGIRYNPTGELFYVTAVTNVANFEGKTERLTSIQVSRGIVEKYYSYYFNLVNLMRNSAANSQNTWTINPQILQFFLNRQQFL